MLHRILRSVLLLAVACTFGATSLMAQTGTVEGTVTDEQTGEVLPGVNVYIQALNRGAATTSDGTYTIEDVPYDTYELRFSYIGYEELTQTVTVDEGTETVDVTLSTTERMLGEVFVTAYGIEQTQNELPYSAQKVDGEIISESNSDNFITSLSGRVAGLKVSQNNGMGGSTNIVMRGYKSISGDNQVLFVVDGVPYSNREFNDSNVEAGFAGYDYGNTAVDINPDNIASVNVMKGPAAAALYGSRASNGAVVIQTKSGQTGQRQVEVTVNSSVGISRVDPETFVDYQDKYGGGYEPIFSQQDIDGDGTDDNVVRHQDDASFGPRFDPSLEVYQWDAFVETGPNFGEPTPWVPAENGPMSFFDTGVNTQNSIMIDGGFEDGHYSLGYNQSNTTGILPNSKLDNHKLNFAAGYDVSEKLTVDASIQYSRTDGRARPSTGYGTMFSQFRQWWATNVDIEDQRQAYFRNRNNNTWNWAPGQAGVGPIYWNNVYWDRYENFATDQRDRYFGYAEARYDVVDWLSFTGRVAIDSYSQMIEERTNKGSAGIATYTQRQQDFTEFNYDLLANYNKQLTDDIGVSGVVGMNIRRNKTTGITAQTNGGLVVPGLYSLDNSINQIQYPGETDRQLGVNGYFASLNINYNDFLNVELTGRRDKSSSLPDGENIYYYPSASAGFVFTEFLDVDWLTFGKIRGSWAEVGNTAPPYSIEDTFGRPSNFGNAALYTLPTTKNNPELKPERTKSWEVGLQMSFFNDRVSYDLNYYDQNTINQILATEVSRASGYEARFVNAGNVENRGIELTITGRPVVSQDFAWTTTINWARNLNKVKELAPGIDNYQLASPQGDVTISAALGEPYGAIRGSDYIYHENGEPIVNQTTGFYETTSSSNNIIGNMNPEWTGGISNRFNYQNWSFNFLVDVRWGGDIFSLDQYYGQGTGQYPVTAAVNDNGMNVRDPVADGGGVILDGVSPNGSANSVYATAENYAGAFGWINNPSSHFIYDGSYVKLREMGLTYNLPQSVINSIGVLRSASISAVGRNLWIIHKNLPHADPEQGIAAGNVQGYQGAVHPSTREFTFNLKLRF